MADVRVYMRGLLSGLAHIHAMGIIHRDIKPSNCLFSRRSGQFAICDFGLAETERLEASAVDDVAEDPHSRPRTRSQATDTGKRRKTTRRTSSTSDSSGASTGITAGSSEPQRTSQRSSRAVVKGSTPRRRRMLPPTMVKREAAFIDSQRAPIAARAGTRGFRAPEVLLRSTRQTVAIDIWAAGIVMLTMLTGRYPFFTAPDDMTALGEIVDLTGTTAIQQLGAKLGKHVLIDAEHYRAEPLGWESVVDKARMNRRLKISPDALDLLSRLLDADPDARITASAAMHHPFIAGLGSAPP
jgi:cell division control protein 7